MQNINNYYYNKFDLQLSNSDYWDLYLASDEYTVTPFTGVTSGTCFVVWYDFNNNSIYSSGSTSANTIYSLVTWTGATNSGFTLNTIGLTGIDNGLITFNKTSGDTSNLALLSALTGSTLVLTSGDTRLMLNRVTGTTGNYIYPINIISTTATTGNYAKLCGGFYQGYYKLDGYDYQVLPNRVNKAFAAEFWLNRTDSCSGYTGTTLNDTYPNNEGFFFYMGTRAENKFWNVFEGLNSGCTSGCTVPSGCTGTVTTFCTIPKENEIILSSGIPLDPPQLVFTDITNQFLIYNRSDGHKCGQCGGSIVPDHHGLTWPKGVTVCCCNDRPTGFTITSTTQTITNKTNPFLIYSRSTGQLCNGSTGGTVGQTVCTFSGMTSPELELDFNLDIIDNALGFRIKNDGSIGYRLLTLTGFCSGNTYVTGTTIQEKYSASGTVSANVWTNIVIRFIADKHLNDNELNCAKKRKGKLMFYINGKLKFVVKDFDEFIARRLNEYRDKQLGVPFNFSLGGGSQGLLESQTFDGQDPRDLGLAIQNNFAGTFIGYISQFKFNICDLNYCDIGNLYDLNVGRYL